MVELQQFERTLNRYIQVPWFLAREAVLDAIATHCKQSYCWQHENQFQVASHVTSQALTTPEHTRINSIVAAAMDGKPLTEGTHFELDGDSIRLKKQMTGHLKVVLSVFPTDDVQSVDRDIYDRYRIEICMGAAADLGQDEKKAWALSKHQIERYQSMFDSGCSDAVQFSLNKAARIYEAQTKHQFF